MTDAWGYVRLSQSGRDCSLDEQKKSIREYCRENGLNLQTTRNDGENTSGYDEDREEYQLLKKKAHVDDIDAVVVRDRARLSRDFDERLEWILRFRGNDVDWHVVESGGLVDVEDLQTAAMECMHAMMDHYKKKAEIERARDAVEERMEKGYDHGRPKYGMTYDDEGRYQVPGEDWHDVVDVLEMDSAGYGVNEISDEIGLPRITVERIVEDRQWYEDRGDM